MHMVWHLSYLSPLALLLKIWLWGETLMHPTPHAM